MSIKILGGLARGFVLISPQIDSTRPTSVMIRRKLFDWRQNLEGEIFIDLFAGSGAVGLEALSRGADKVLLNDSNRNAFNTLKRNAEKFLSAFKLDASLINLTAVDAVKWVGRELSFQVASSDEVIIFLDPPYENHALYWQVLDELRKAQFSGEIWLEADRLIGPPREQLNSAFKSVTKIIEQGDHFVMVGKLI
jgi:16S rRNA (guanine966-N2)-methyltransferase